MSVAVLAATGASGLSNSFTINASADMIVVASHREYSSAPTLGAKLNGVDLAPLAADASVTGIEAIDVFYALATTIASIGSGPQTLTFTETGGAGLQGRNSTIIQLQGASQSVPTSAHSNGNDTNPTNSVSAVATGGIAIGFHTNNNAAAATTPGTGFTSFYDASDSGGGDSHGAAEYKLSPSVGANTINWTISSTFWAAVGVIVEAAGGAVVSPTSIRNVYVMP